MSLFGVGNPLLDTIIQADEAFMAKYKLVTAGYCFEGEDQAGIYEEMGKMHPVYVPGGATQNTVRVAQALLSEPRTAYSGSAGDDAEGMKMEKLLRESGTTPMYYFDKEHPTGMCGVAVSSCGDRSMCTRLGAADHFPLSHLHTPELQAAVERAEIVYSAGFFLTVCVDGMVELGKHCSDRNKIFATNLCAEFIVEHFKDQMLSVLPYADFLFGNEAEWEHFAKINADILNNVDPKNLQEVARRVAALPKVNDQRPRTVVITQGSNETIVATHWLSQEQVVEVNNKKRKQSSDLFKVTLYPVVPLLPSQIVDTNGAGDAFVGGYMAALLEGRSEADCVALAHYAARHIVQRSGATVDFQKEDPERPIFK